MVLKLPVFRTGDRGWSMGERKHNGKREGGMKCSRCRFWQPAVGIADRINFFRTDTRQEKFVR